MATLTRRGVNITPSANNNYFDVYGSSTGGRGDSNNTTPVYPSSASGYFKVLKCDDNWYLTPYTTNAGLNNFRSLSVSRNSYDLSFEDSWRWLKEHDFINPDITTPETSWGSYFIAYPLIVNNVDNINNSSSVAKFYVDSYNPIFSATFQDLLSCSSRTWYGNTTNGYYQFTSVFNIDVDDSGGSTNIDATGLAPAILMIPATMLVICFFSIIYNMFMNRKVRG